MLHVAIHAQEATAPHASFRLTDATATRIHCLSATERDSWAPMVVEVGHRLRKSAQVPHPQPPLVAAACQRVWRQAIPGDDVDVCLLSHTHPAASSTSAIATPLMNRLGRTRRAEVTATEQSNWTARTAHKWFVPGAASVMPHLVGCDCDLRLAAVPRVPDADGAVHRC